MSLKKIQSALISVYYKDGLAPLVELLHQHGVALYSTGGTQMFIEQMNIPVTAVEDLTSYPSIFGGRVKTLHQKYLVVSCIAVIMRMMCKPQPSMKSLLLIW